MRYTLDSMLPVRAFSPRGGRGPFKAGMTLEGGGGGGGGFFDDVSSVLGTDGSGGGILGGISDVVQVIGGALADVDKAVGDVIPGGWATIGAAALMAYGIYDPELLASADEGTLTTTELSNAGYNAETVASGVSNASAEAGFADPATYDTALSQGFTNATEYANATSAGFTNASEYANATLNGFTNAAEYNTATAAGFTDAGTFQAASDAGFANAAEFNTATNLGYTNAAEYTAGSNAGFADAAEYNTASNLGYTNAAEYNTASNLGYTNAADFQAGSNAGFTNAAEYNTTMANGGFTDPTTFNQALSKGFTDASTFDTATANGFTDANQFNTATNLGYSNASDYAQGTLGNFNNAEEYKAATDLGYTNASNFSEGELGGYNNAQDWKTASDLGYANNAQYQTGLQLGSGNADEMMTTLGMTPEQADALTSSGGWDTTDIATAVAAGYLAPQVLHILGIGAQPTSSGQTHQWMPIPTYTATGLVNPGENPGMIEPSSFYGQQQPGTDQYYWGQHGYVQGPTGIAGLENYNNNTNGAPVTPYGNPNAVNLGKLVTPEQIGYPNPQEMNAAFGPGHGYNPAPIMASDQYTGLNHLNTTPPPIAGNAGAFHPGTNAQMALGQSPTQQLGQGLNYVAYPAQPLATVNNSGMVPAQQLTNISPQELSAQLLAAANAANPAAPIAASP